MSLITAVSLDDVRTELSYRLCETRGGLREFSKQAWQYIEPSTPLEWSWPHDAVCDHLEAVSYGEITDLVINIPPRHMKSTLVAIMWPCWEWGPAGLPHTRWIFSSYAQSLSQRDSQRRRMLMATDWYRSGWDTTFTLGRQKYMSDGQIKYVNSKMGYHLATSVQGSNTGEGGDRLVADDPHNMKEIHSETVRDGVIQWWDQVMSTRINDQRKPAKVIIMQRGHESDLAGHVIRKGTSVHLNLQAEFVPNRRCVTPIFTDPRSQPGELLFPSRFPADVIARLKLEMGDAYHAQFQQDPTPAEGGILKRAWWRYWAPQGHELVGQKDENDREILALPGSFDRLLNSWDLAFKDQEHNDYVVGQSWGRAGAISYLVGQKRGHFDFIETQWMIRQLRTIHRQRPNAVYVEDAANGPAIMATLRNDIPGLLAADVDRSKEARAHAASPRLKAGNYAIPHPALGEEYTWVAGPLTTYQNGFLETGSFLNELTMFPNASHDDQVDAFTQADRYLYLTEEFSEEMFGGGRHGF